MWPAVATIPGDHAVHEQDPHRLIRRPRTVDCAAQSVHVLDVGERKDTNLTRLEMLLCSATRDGRGSKEIHRDGPSYPHAHRSRESVVGFQPLDGQVRRFSRMKPGLSSRTAVQSPGGAAPGRDVL